MHRPVMLVLFAVISACAQQRETLVNAYSPEKEAALGAQLAASVMRQSKIVESAAISRYVDRIGGNLAAVLPDHAITYNFRVVEDNLGGSTHEPLALPGGSIFIPASLLLAARSEAELAGMLAHGIAHVAARHGTRQATRAQIMDITPGPFIFVSSVK